MSSSTPYSLIVIVHTDLISKRLFYFCKKGFSFFSFAPTITPGNICSTGGICLSTTQTSSVDILSCRAYLSVGFGSTWLFFLRRLLETREKWWNRVLSLSKPPDILQDRHSKCPPPNTGRVYMRNAYLGARFSNTRKPRPQHPLQKNDLAAGLPTLLGRRAHDHAGELTDEITPRSGTKKTQAST